jgi:hypothetical protein
VVDWRRFTPSDFEYDFERDELARHGVTFDEAVECFFSDFQIRRNKKYLDRYQLIGRVGWTNTEDHLPARTAAGRSHHHRVANMKERQRARGSKPKPTPDQIDRQVVADADVDSAWQRAIVVRRPKLTSLCIPAELAARATFLARLHRERKVDKWVERIVRERVEIEESAFTAAKKTLAS